ncbi:MAG TPA: hypothetical protein VMI72_10865, partial [Roseiarcus sp.]|nr:hypothetical protein [Roseiarcus sp.]
MEALANRINSDASTVMLPEMNAHFEKCGLAHSQTATEWSGSQIIYLGDGTAYGINDAGQAVGYSTDKPAFHAVEWSGGQVIDLGGLPG